MMTKQLPFTVSTILCQSLLSSLPTKALWLEGYLWSENHFFPFAFCLAHAIQGNWSNLQPQQNRCSHLETFFFDICNSSQMISHEKYVKGLKQLEEEYFRGAKKKKCQCKCPGFIDLFQPCQTIYKCVNGPGQMKDIGVQNKKCSFFSSNKSAVSFVLNVLQFCPKPFYVIHCQAHSISLRSWDFTDQA